MNETERLRWQSDVLDQIFAILAHSPAISRSLVFKGARVLNLRLGTLQRQSFDLDSNVSADFAEAHPDLNEQRLWLERELTHCLERGFERMSPVRYRLDRLRLERQPPKHHPLGWDAFKAKLSVQDLARAVRGLPRLELDIAAPERLSPHSVADLELEGSIVRAYTLERLAGEKLRAFLTSLPAYTCKLGRSPRPRRVKDLYDLARIAAERPLDDHEFWNSVAQEFRLACESRYVDCMGIETFAQDLSVTRDAYEKDPNLPKDMVFGKAWAIVEAIVAHLEEVGVLPLACEIPETPTAPLEGDTG